MAAKSDFLGTWLQGFCPQESRRDRLILPQQHVFLLFSLQLPSSPSLVFIYPFPPRFSINSFCVTFIFPSQLLLQLYRPYTPYRTPFGMSLIYICLIFLHSQAKDSPVASRCVSDANTLSGIYFLHTFLNIHTPVFLQFPQSICLPNCTGSAHSSWDQYFDHKSLKSVLPQGPLCSTLAPVLIESS
jgi:hypothetical protein